MVALLIVFLFVAVAVLSLLYGSDSRQLEKRATDWPFQARPPQL
jgi:hypothetical protein